MPFTLTETFKAFFDSERFSAVVLLACTVAALVAANSPIGPGYLAVWQAPLAGMSLQHWINDGLMAIFFLLIGLELEREIHSGELSSLRKALLPMVAALGGIVVPASIHFALNAGTPTQPGFGIPMATDIALALGVLAILGPRVPTSLRMFVAALAVVDDLGAIIVIATLYTAKLSLGYLLAAAVVWLALFSAGRWLRWNHLAPYLAGGVVLWWLLLMSGVHATLAGVALAFAIPYSSRADDAESPSHRLEHALYKPVALVRPAAVRAGQYRRGARQRLAFAVGSRQRRRHRIGPGRGQTSWRAGVLRHRGGAGPGAAAEGHELAPPGRRRHARRHRLHDGDLHRLARLRRRRRDLRCLQARRIRRLAGGGRARLPVAAVLLRA